MKRKIVGVDMHCHLLPGVDDGCRDIKESIKIINMMKKKGINNLFLTPHLYSPNVNSEGDLFDEKLEELRINIDNDVNLKLGSEVYILPGVSKKRVIPLGNSNYLLVEFPVEMFPISGMKELYEFQKKGYKIILAHIERYSYLYRDNMINVFKGTVEPTDLLIQMKNMGIFFQVNWNTLINPTLKQKRILRLLNRFNWIDFTGSDKHNLRDKRELIDKKNNIYTSLRNEELLT
ncbi:MAG: CpsB/CapC family capsule biosynthesis tyrosine phosphatase [Kosmotogaceae bacterium]